MTKYVVYKAFHNGKKEVDEIVKAQSLTAAKKEAFRKHCAAVLNLEYQIGVVTEATAKREHII